MGLQAVCVECLSQICQELFWLLWGPHTSLKKNVENFNNLWKEKHAKRS